MLPRRSRLPAVDFRSMGYRTVRTPYFALKAKNNHTEVNRIGVITGVQVHKSAVKRNFWKRQAKAALEGIPQSGKDILIILTSKVNALTRAEFKKIVRSSTAELISKT